MGSNFRETIWLPSSSDVTEKVRISLYNFSVTICDSDIILG